MSERKKMRIRPDASATPQPLALLRCHEVQAIVRLSRSTIWRAVRNGAFPKPVRVGAHAIAWRRDEIDSWILDRSRGRYEK